MKAHPLTIVSWGEKKKKKKKKREKKIKQKQRHQGDFWEIMYNNVK